MAAHAMLLPPLSLHPDLSMAPPASLPTIVVCVSAAAALWLYYFTYVRAWPTVLLGRDPFLRRVAARCESLSRAYHPTFWCHDPWAQACICSLRIDISRRWYRAYGTPLITERVCMRDGQEVLLHWMDMRTLPSPPIAVVLVLHTVTGSTANHVDFMVSLARRGMLAVGFDRRGNGDIPLHRPTFNTTGCVRDMCEVIDHVKWRHGDVPLYCIGFSAGSSLLAMYLGLTGVDSRLAAACLISPGYDMEVAMKQYVPLAPRADWLTTKCVQALFLGRLLQNPAAREKLTEEQRDAIDRLEKATNLQEWHRDQHHFTGHASEVEYYAAHDAAPLVRHIRTPTLFINAQDDMMFPRALIERWSHVTVQSEHVGVVHTAKGGHCSFLQGLYAEGSWAETLAVDFLVQHFTEVNSVEKQAHPLLTASRCDTPAPPALTNGRDTSTNPRTVDAVQDHHDDDDMHSCSALLLPRIPEEEEEDDGLDENGDGGPIISRHEPFRGRSNCVAPTRPLTRGADTCVALQHHHDHASCHMCTHTHAVTSAVEAAVGQSVSGGVRPQGIRNGAVDGQLQNRRERVWFTLRVSQSTLRRLLPFSSCIRRAQPAVDVGMQEEDVGCEEIKEVRGHRPGASVKSDRSPTRGTLFKSLGSRGTLKARRVPGG